MYFTDSISIYGKGEVISETINVSNFSKISNVGIADVNIKTGLEHKVVVHAQENIINVMTFEVKNDKLTLSFENNVNIKQCKDIDIDIFIPNLEYFGNVGTGDIFVEGENQSDLDINIVGTGNINCFNLSVDYCDIDITGVGNCKVNVSTFLEVFISGIGNVYYKGYPEVKKSIIGIGKVINDN